MQRGHRGEQHSYRPMTGQPQTCKSRKQREAAARLMLLTPKKSLKPQSAWLSLKVVLVSATAGISQQRAVPPLMPAPRHEGKPLRRKSRGSELQR